MDIAAPRPAPERRPRSESPSRDTTATELNALRREVEEAHDKVASLSDAQKTATTAAERSKEGAELLQSKVASRKEELAEHRRGAAKREQHEDMLKAMCSKERALEEVIRQLRAHQNLSAVEASRMACYHKGDNRGLGVLGLGACYHKGDNRGLGVLGLGACYHKSRRRVGAIAERRNAGAHDCHRRSVVAGAVRREGDGQRHWVRGRGARRPPYCRPLRQPCLC